MFIICRFERIICKSYNKVSNFIVHIHKYCPVIFVHPARQQKKTAGDTWSASSPSQSSLRDASSPKVGALGSPRRLHLFAKASPFGRGGTAIAVTERASLLKIKAPATKFRRFSGIQKRSLQMLSCFVVHLFSGNKIRRVHQLFSQCSVMLPPCCPTVVRTLFRSDPCCGRPSASSAGTVSV